MTDLDLQPIRDQVSRLIDPESEFFWKNVEITGIDSGVVSECPNFKEFCSTAGFLGLIDEYVFVAYNATGTDLHHIEKSLSAYGTDMPEMSYIDTMSMFAPVLNIGSLEAACCELNIDFGEHHNALSDAEACMRLFRAPRDSYDDLPEAVWAREAAGSKSRPSDGARVVNGLGLTNGTHERIEDVLNALDAMGLRGSLDGLDAVSGHRFVVSGRVAGYAGSPSEPGSIESVLKAVGAKTSNSVSGRTEYLAIGDNAGAKKISDAKSRDVPVVTVGELLELLSRSPAVENDVCNR